MRVFGNHHAVGLLGWAEMIDETPGSNGLELGMGDAAFDLDPGSGAEFHQAGFDDHIWSLIR